MSLAKDGLNFIIDKILPKNYSLIEENNILGIYDKQTLITKDENFVVGIEVYGISYTALNDDKIFALLNDRKNAINAINDNVNIKILIRRRKKIFDKKYDIENVYAKNLINLWEKNEEIYENSYIILIETRNKSAISYLEQTKQNLTTSKNEDNNDVNLTYINKINILQNIITRITQSLSEFGVSILESSKVLNIYAEYCNGFYVNIEPRIGLLSDSYIASNVTFKKDYFIQEWNGKVKYGRFIGIKAYDVEEISSLFLNNLLYLEKELNINFYIEKISKLKALSRISEKIKLSTNIAKPLLSNLKELIQSDRESMQYLTFNVLVIEDSKDKLESSSSDISTIFTNQGLINTYETINQLPVYFSFFPNKEFLNNRKRIQTTDAISTMLLFEKDISGHSSNSWGNFPLTMFKNQNKSPFLFNLHTEDKKQSLGHTLIIGGTGSGKTTLISWLMLNCLKYDINILSFDKLNGLYALTNYLNGEYIDGNNEETPFQLNPFSLEYSNENKNFLIDWLSIYLNINKDEISDTEAIVSIEKVIDQTFRVLKQQNIPFNILEIKDAIIKQENDNIKMKLESASNNPIFNSLEDSINMNNKINVINMDFIESMEKEAGLIAYYILYKMLYLAKNKSKGFFFFIDEFRTYANNEVIIDRVNYIVTQARKADGVIALALQDLNQLNDIKNANSIVQNMGNFIIFPTQNINILEQYNIHLSDYEKTFLKDSSQNCRKVLFKNVISKTSNIIDIDLSKLGSNLNFLSSNASDVNLIKNIKRTNPQNWRELYIKAKNDGQ